MIDALAFWRHARASHYDAIIVLVYRAAIFLAISEIVKSCGHYDPFFHFFDGDLVFCGFHLTFAAQYAADSLPLAMFLR